MRIERYDWYAAVDPAGKQCFVSFSDEELAERPELATDEKVRNQHIRRILFWKDTTAGMLIRGFEQRLMPDGTTEVTITLRSKPEVKDE